ncbi:helix-turn-helix domain-containing protein [Luteipulveratus flavus]|uniref:Helix-turn-helix transcriptional regulator n=1 Tax=Luteipulveratus flavus TaxID=3031728 RepID=A0ABT6CCN8_9MICO|nr:helix-turn-helix transcriptional regulator [Luteipulveratus sp. YIM 133296]MDF8266147.1 helix-turn-helix transcriptional regulator [Luteipulveratus sp. YIM 133296]
MAMVDLHDLMTTTHEVSGRLARIATGRATVSGVTLLACGPVQIMRALDDLERSARVSAVTSLPMVSFDPEDPGFELNERSRARGISLHLTTTPLALATNPMIVCTSPNVLIGPASLRTILVDDRLAIVEGPPTRYGESTAWRCERGTELFELASGYLTSLVAASTPALAPGEKPPLTPRQVRVARAMCLGLTDEAIGRRLDISTRSVEREVAAVLRALGARARTEAVLNMMGRGRAGSADARARAVAPRAMQTSG